MIVNFAAIRVRIEAIGEIEVLQFSHKLAGRRIHLRLTNSNCATLAVTHFLQKMRRIDGLFDCWKLLISKLFCKLAIISTDLPYTIDNERIK